MRLIDADKIEWEYKCISKEEIDEQPKIVALPLDYVTKNFHHSEFEQIFIFVLHMWEKENEIN